MVEFLFIFQVAKFYKLVNYLGLFGVIFQIRNFWVGCKISNNQMWNDRGFGISKLRISK